MSAELVVRNIGRLATLAGPVPRTGAAMGDLGIVERAAVIASAGRITYAGLEAGMPAAEGAPPASSVRAPSAAGIPASGPA